MNRTVTLRVSCIFAIAALALVCSGCITTKKTERMSAFGSHSAGDKTTARSIPTYQVGDPKAKQNGGR